MVRSFLPWVIALAGCAGTVPRAPAPPEAGSCADQLLTHLRHRAPPGWEVNRVRSGTVTPMHWPEGSGTELRAHATGTTGTDWKQGRGGDVYVWIMEAGYGGSPQAESRSQVEAANEIGTCDGGRVLVLGIGNQEWPAWKDDVRGALRVGS